MYRFVHITLLVLLLSIAGLGVWGACGLTKHLISAIDNWGQIPEGINATLSRVNGPHGTIVELDKTILAAKSLEVHTDMVVAHEEKQLAKLDQQERALFADIHDTLSGVNTLSGNLSNTAIEFTVLEGQANQTLQTWVPLANEGTQVLTTFNGRLSDPKIDALLTSFRDIADSGKGIMADGKTVADYGTKQLTTPKTWVQKLETRAGDTYDILGWLARHYN